MNEKQEVSCNVVMCIQNIIVYIMCIFLSRQLSEVFSMVMELTMMLMYLVLAE